MAEPTQTIANERIKLTAEFLSKAGALLIAAGVIIPVVRGAYGALIMVPIGALMIWGGFWFLGRLT